MRHLAPAAAAALVGTLALASAPGAAATEEDTFYVGASMDYAPFLEEHGLVFKEDGQPKEALASLRDAGANLVRWHFRPPPYTNASLSGSNALDHMSFERVTENLRRTKELGMESALTFMEASSASHFPTHRPNMVTDDLRAIADRPAALAEAIHGRVFGMLDELGGLGLMPRIAVVGNEVNERFYSNLEAEEVVDRPRNAKLLSAGFRAIRDAAEEHQSDTLVGVHIFGPEHVRWFVETMKPLGLTDYDVLCLSYYPGWHPLGEWNDLGELAAWLEEEHGKKLMIFETSASARSLSPNEDGRVNIYFNGPDGYAEDGEATPADQKKFMVELCRDVYEGGGLGVVYWGADHVANDSVRVWGDEYGPGSSWENNTFWDAGLDLHEGATWMRATREAIAGGAWKAPATAAAAR
ncbi:glycoside hydrolase family 53 protein [Phycisphaera mikurensis]|uniref:Arabinogalactan endo-beta-1,4-galactanase n=1 Tax=Phycisphaera mikurensis (strain NBRC 102666 / KCTC 22515 / FYK2301M01) TaxID=1142394 RepID=I0ID22_PHYMF|nr:glycosyl hydrolase 53 family protein [Phycisphaera mikurensis]MBB6442285.1 arabinogalactan endo-1,4-beta-galactosidase [Phycisphaera mikurensis]BAM03160.1 putative glucosidase [Phycisphaera mikurensis NBRC 102666]